MSKFKNKRKESFLDTIPTISLDDKNNELTLKCKFNFGYFDSLQEVGEDFKDWNYNNLVKLFEKLKEYSKESLEHWAKQPIGSGKHRSNVFVIYDRFPINSDFFHPKHIPHQVMWARFRLEQAVRLIGFVIPDECHDEVHKITGKRFDKNTFYVVFLDEKHRFYKTI